MIKGLIIAGLFFIIGVISACLYLKWGVIKPHFFEFTILDLLQLVLSVIIAFFLTIFVGNHLSNRQSQKSILHDQINTLEKKISQILEVSTKYMKSPTENGAREALALFKEARAKYYFIKAFSSKHHICKDTIFDTEFEKGVIHLRSILTSKQFLTETPSYDEKTIRKFLEKYESILNKLTEYKLKIYK